MSSISLGPSPGPPSEPLPFSWLSGLLNLYGRHGHELRSCCCAGTTILRTRSRQTVPVRCPDLLRSSTVETMLASSRGRRSGRNPAMATRPGGQRSRASPRSSAGRVGEILVALYTKHGVPVSS